MQCGETGSGQDKWQCTAQLTLFADGVPRVKPFVIFKGIGQRIASTEKNNTTTVWSCSSRKILSVMRL